MKVIVTKSHAESCRLTAQTIADIVSKNPKTVLGLATGSTAEQVYAELISIYKAGKLSFKDVQSLNLDEYVGLAPAHEQSYRYFMNKHFFSHIDINIGNTYVPLGNTNHSAELKVFQSKLAALPRDFQLLGVGSNGHIAFNEPSSSLHADAHIVDIAPATIKANSRYFASEADVPKKAFTQGMGNILTAKSIALLATGAVKADAMKALLFGDEITSACPCTFLKTHPNTTIYLDQDLADMISYKG